MSFQNYRKHKAQRDDKGQATVEFALVLPFVVISLLLLMQVLVIVLAHVQVVNAARNGVRAAAVSAAHQAHKDGRPRRTGRHHSPWANSRERGAPVPASSLGS